jgi:hypothetical protein
MRWARSGATELAIRQKDNLLRAFEDSRCHPPANAKTSVMSLLRPRLAVSSALSKKATSPEICVQERRIYLAVSDTVLKERRTARELLGWRPPRAAAKGVLRASNVCRDSSAATGAVRILPDQVLPEDNCKPVILFEWESTHSRLRMQSPQKQTESKRYVKTSRFVTA